MTSSREAYYLLKYDCVNCSRKTELTFRRAILMKQEGVEYSPTMTRFIGQTISRLCYDCYAMRISGR